MSYIVVPKWNEFQHYKDRDPKWIKNYTRLLSDDAYLNLSGHRRAVLHGVWLEYARSNGQLRDDTRTLTRRLNVKVTSLDLEVLNQAGFLRVVASKPLAIRYKDAILETEKEIETPKPPFEKKPKGQCPECTLGGGYHLADCSRRLQAVPSKGAA